MADHAYTDAHGYPLTAIEAARRAANPKSTGYYHNGVWRQRRPRKPKDPANDQVPAPDRPADG